MKEIQKKDQILLQMFKESMDPSKLDENIENQWKWERLNTRLYYIFVIVTIVFYYMGSKNACFFFLLPSITCFSMATRYDCTRRMLLLQKAMLQHRTADDQ